ncbi:MAG: YhdP family protein [Pseudomonadota bacterium]
MHDPFADFDPGTRRWIRRVFWTVAGVVIFAMSVSALFATALNLLPGYRDRLEHFASEAVQQPLRIGDLALDWRGGTPGLDLQQVELLTADEKTTQLRVESLRLGFSPWRLVFGDFTPVRIALAGLELSAQVDAEGQWRIRGLEALLTDDGETDLDGTLQGLARFEAIALERCTISLKDARLGPMTLRFGVERAELSQGLRGPRLDAQLTLPESVGERLNLRARFRGRLEARATWNGDWSAEIEDVRSLPWLRWLNPSLAALRIENGQLRINGELRDGQPQWADVSLRALALRGGSKAPKATLKGLALTARVSAQPFGWQAEVQNLQVEGSRGVWPKTSGVVSLIKSATGGEAEWGLRLNFLRLDDLVPWLDLAVQDAPALQGLSGDLRAVDASFKPGSPEQAARYSLRTAFEQLGLPAGDRAAGVSGLSGEVALDENGGRLGLQAAAFKLSLPRVFSMPLPVESLTTGLRWKREAEGWTFSAPQFRWAFAGSEGRGEFALKLTKSPVLSLKAQFSVKDAARLKPFMPLHWGAGLRDWLTRGLVRTPITQAQLVIDGPLADFPFDKKPGAWSLDANVADAEVFYAAGWPEVRSLNADLAFRGNGLAIRVNQGTIAELPVQKVEARFRDFSDSLLSVNGQVAGDLGRFYSVLAASPLRPRFEGLLKHTRARGPGQLDLRLDIPLNHPGNTDASGRVVVSGAELLLTDINEPVRELRGEVGFGADGIHARKLEGRLMDQPLTGSITARKSGSALTAFWSLDLGATSVAAKKLPEGLRARLSGNTAVRAQLRLSGPDPAALVLDSDLRGVQMRLPAPLAKATGAAAPLRLVISEDPKSGPRISADWSGRLGADLRWRLKGAQSQLDAITLRLGRDAPVFTEALPGLSLGAVVSDLSVDDWLGFIDDLGDAKSTLGALPLTRANLRVERWLWRGFQLPQTQLRAQPEGAGWRLRLDGAGAEGEVLWMREKIQARLMHLALAHNPNTAETRTSKTVQDPGRWPELDVEVGRFEIADALFGAIIARTQKIPGGQKLLALSSRGGENDLNASGLWLRRDGRSSANLGLRLISTDFEGVQRAFGFGATLVAKATRINLQAAWAPSAPGLSWQQARGDLALEFDNGFLRGIEPGVGRVLGLFNFYALPRRLSLNFGDVADQGLAFDTVRGSFTIADGQARTENVEVKGPSLRIAMRGRAGLVARDYDQRVTVYPGLSTGFTLGAAALAGPIGAGLVFLAQQILDQPLEKLTQINYRVTGSWDDPQVSGD